MHLFHLSTCFEQPRSHRQENKLYQYNIRYVSLWPSSMQVGMELPYLHIRRSPTQSDTYQMLYWYNWFSWWWARGCSKHIEKWNKCIRIVSQIGYLHDLYQDVRSAKHKILLFLPNPPTPTPNRNSSLSGIAYQHLTYLHQFSCS
jgi:hypothetical protein